MPKQNRAWIKKINDKTLDSIINKDIHFEKVPDELNTKFYKTLNTFTNIKKENIFITKYFKFSYAFTSIIIIVILTGFLIFNLYLNKVQNNKFLNICKVKNIKGKALLINIKNKKAIELSNGYNLSESSLINTEKNSVCELEIGNKSIIRLYDNTELNLKKLYKKNNIENTEISIKYGDVYFKPAKIETGSSFKVNTDYLVINVTGTEFFVSENKNYSKIYVREGSISINLNIEIKKINKIKKINEELANKINDFIFEKITININEKIELSNSQFVELYSQTLKLIKTIEKELETNKKDTKKLNETIKNAHEKLLILHEKRLSIIEKKNIQFDELQKIFKEDNKEVKQNDENKFNIINPGFNLGLSFTEKNCAIISDNKNIYIASEKDKAIYCIDPVSKKLAWKFTSNWISTISCIPIVYNDKIIFGTPEYIFILNIDGSLFRINDLKNGPVYWPEIIKINDKIYVPTSKDLYEYNGNKFSLLENFPDFLGQIYISSDNKNIVALFLFEKRIRLYNLTDKKIIWESNMLKQRSFIKPIIINNHILICDCIGNIYKFDYDSNNSAQIILNLGVGIKTNIINKNDFIYFIADDGYFYGLNLNTFKNIDKIFKVDYTPDINKYFTKKLLLIDNYIFFSSDTGKIYCYDTGNNKTQFINIDSNIKNFPLVGTPVIINNNIFAVDTSSNIYCLNIK